MASVARQPFAPIDGARLQSLTSTKNRQNGNLPTLSKRKALDSVESDNSENIDPVPFSKRSKGSSGIFSACKKPSFVLQPAIPAPRLDKEAAPAVHSRTILKPRAPSMKSGRSSLASSAAVLSRATAGRGTKRSGILSNHRRRPSSAFSRIDPAGSKLAPAAPFSLDAALKGTLSAFSSPLSSTRTALGDNEINSSWIFDIHEDSPEQEMTNLLQHSTCVLDISSDEESEQKARREKDEGRDKENIPPANDISQTSRVRSEPTDDMLVEKSRNPLSQLDVADFYAAGCDEATVVIVACDDAEETVARQVEFALPETTLAIPENNENVVEQERAAKERTAEDGQDDGEATVEELMSNRNEPCAMAAVLEPVEGTGESFDLWESGSSKDISSPPSPAGDGALEDAMVGGQQSTSL